MAVIRPLQSESRRGLSASKAAHADQTWASTLANRPTHILRGCPSRSRQRVGLPRANCLSVAPRNYKQRCLPPTKKPGGWNDRQSWDLVHSDDTPGPIKGGAKTFLSVTGNEIERLGAGGADAIGGRYRVNPQNLLRKAVNNNESFPGNHVGFRTVVSAKPAVTHDGFRRPKRALLFFRNPGLGTMVNRSGDVDLLVGKFFVLYFGPGFDFSSLVKWRDSKTNRDIGEINWEI